MVKIKKCIVVILIAVMSMEICSTSVSATNISDEVFNTNEVSQNEIEVDEDIYEDANGTDAENILETETSASENVRNKIISYVNGLGGSFNKSYAGKASGCFALCNYVWKNVFGYDYYAKKHTRKEDASGGNHIYSFLVNNGAKTGDILWLGGEHNVIILSYDSNGMTITDGSSSGKVLHNGTYLKYTSSGIANYLRSSKKLVLYKSNDAIFNSLATPDPVRDTTPPQITNIRVTDVGIDGYTVSCTVTDNMGVNRVQFPTWTDKNGQDDIAWKEGNQFGTNTSQNVTFKVNTSEHNNEGDWYNTHIYAWDTSGNSTNTGVRVFIDKTPPQITNIQVTNIGLDGYTVSCIVTDNCGVARVQFPSWTTYNDQDDITPTWWTNAVATGSRSGNVFSYYVSRDSHNQEVLGYMTHIYAYDEAGNYTYASAVNQLSLIGIAQDIGDEFQSAIQNVKTGKYLTQEDSGNVASYENMNLDAQKWKFKQLSDGSYQILSLKNDYSLDCWGVAENETNIASSPYHGRDNQRWYLYGNEKDGYYIMPKNSVSCGVSLNYASSENGTNAKMYNIYASSDQRFYIKGSKNITPVEDKKTAENKNSLKDENPETDKQPTKNDSSVGDEGITNITQNNSTATFISRMYTVALGRTAEQSGLNSWTQKLSDKEIDGAGIANGFINSAEFKNRNLNNSDYLDVLYRTFFDREADAVGKSYWMDKLQKGTSRTEVLSGFVNSQEFSGLCDRFDIARGTMQTNGTSIYRPGVRSYVLRMYTKALNRDGETVGVEDWTNRINTRVMSPEAVAKSFFSSQEFINRKLNNADYVETLYQTFMDRASDVKGKQYWIDKLNGGTSRQQVLEGFSRSEEFSKIMKRYGL